MILVEYGDFECPNCKQAAPVVKLLRTEFADRVRFVYRHFPLEEVHPHALAAALAAECAGGQGKFWPMHDLLFEHIQALNPHHLNEYAQQLELDMARFTAEMADTIYLQRIREHTRLLSSICPAASCAIRFGSACTMRYSASYITMPCLSIS